MQAFPKRDKAVGKLVRKLVIPDEGYEIAEGDAKQQEPRLFGHFSEDENLCRGYLYEGLDIHDMTMQNLGLDRDTAKRLGMGMLTGMQAPALGVHMHWTLEQAVHYWDGFFMLFPGIKKFQKDAKGIFKSTGYVKSILGRKARLDDPQYAYRAVSRIIQNSGGDHNKMCLLRACEYEEANPEVEILMPIHDSLIWQRFVEFDDDELIKVMENVANELGLDIPIPFEVGRGFDWAQASYGNK
jgi:DNA polymerase-1